MCYLFYYRNIFESLKERTWVGLTDKVKEGEWRWLNGEIALPKQTAWKEGEPNDHQRNEDCGQLTPKNPVLGDMLCSKSFSGICEIDEIRLSCKNCKEGMEKFFQSFCQISLMFISFLT